MVYSLNSMFKTIQPTSLTITQIEKINYLKADESKYASPLPFFLKQEFDLAKNKHFGSD